jgi:hypothetical protein
MGLPGKGGRGQRVKYQCKTKRIPIDLEPQIDQMIALYIKWVEAGRATASIPTWIQSEAVTSITYSEPEKEEYTAELKELFDKYDEECEQLLGGDEYDDDYDEPFDDEKEFYESPRAVPEIKLTAGQEAALAKLKAFMAGSGKYFRLTGYAGTGKSFLICEFVRWLQQNKFTFCAASPTNKASKNLFKLARSAGLEVEVNTVARLLGQQPVIDKETGHEHFLADEAKDLSSFNVVLVDEFSMVSKSNFEALDEAVIGKTKLIFIGDASQLPPVGEREPIVATLNMASATLSEVVRYDGTIAHVAEDIRATPKYNSIIYPFTTSDDATLVCLPRDGWLRDCAEMWQKKCHDTPTSLSMSSF